MTVYPNRFDHKHRPISRADKVRSMTDEELASVFMRYADCKLCKVTKGICNKDYAQCKGAWLEWLRQEADE